MQIALIIQLVRIRTRHGTRRVTIEKQDTLLQLRHAAAEENKFDPSEIVLSWTGNAADIIKDENNTLEGLGIKYNWHLIKARHGDLIYAVEIAPVPDQSVSVETLPPVQIDPKDNQDIDYVLSKQDGLIYRGKDPNLYLF